MGPLILQPSYLQPPITPYVTMRTHPFTWTLGHPPIYHAFIWISLISKQYNHGQLWASAIPLWWPLEWAQSRFSSMKHRCTLLTLCNVLYTQKTGICLISISWLDNSAYKISFADSICTVVNHSSGRKLVDCLHNTSNLCLPRLHSLPVPNIEEDSLGLPCHPRLGNCIGVCN